MYAHKRITHARMHAHSRAHKDFAHSSKYYVRLVKY